MTCLWLWRFQFESLIPLRQINQWRQSRKALNGHAGGMWHVEDLNQSEPIDIENHRRSIPLWRVPRHASDAGNAPVKAMQPSLLPTSQTAWKILEHLPWIHHTCSCHAKFLTACGRKEWREKGGGNRYKIILDETKSSTHHHMFTFFSTIFHCKGSFQHQE